MQLIKNNITYNIDEGSTITRNQNETLDSATIRLAFQSNKIDIEPFDDVVLHDEDGRFADMYMCVNTYDETQNSLDNGTLTYTYLITLFSQTKKLEGIVLPSLSITQLRVGLKRSIMYYINEYNRVYGDGFTIKNNGFTTISHTYQSDVPTTSGEYINFTIPSGRKVFDVKVANNDYYLKIDHIDYQDDRIYFYFTKQVPAGTTITFNVYYCDEKWANECPEMQWNEPTFREVLNTLMMVNDCVVILNNNVIDWLDLTTKGNPINNYNYVRRSQTSDDYCSEIRMNLQNVMQTKVDGIKNTTTTIEYLTFTSDSAIITSENVILKTQFPILKINHLWMCLLLCEPAQVSTDTYKLKKIDLMNICSNANDTGGSLVKEIKEFQTLELLYDANIGFYEITNHKVDDYYSKYQNFNIYYTRNSNVITGFTNVSKNITFGSLSTGQFLRWLTIKAVPYSNYQEHDTSINVYFTPFFQIEYETTYNTTFSASKQVLPRNKRVIIDNQTNSWVDAYTQGNLEYQKANRLGNQIAMINQRCLDNNYIKLTDYLNNEIVYQVEYAIYKHHIDVNAYAVKDYILRNYYTGIQSKIRTWVNAKEEAFIRSDLHKYYCEFNGTLKDNLSGIGVADVKKFITPLIDANNYNSLKPINYVGITTSRNGILYPDNTHYFCLNVINRLIGNSIVFTSGFEDNYYGCKTVSTGNDATGYINISNIQTTASSKEVSPYIEAKATDVPGTATPTYHGVGGVPTKSIGYVDGNGEYDTIIYRYFNDINNSIPTTIMTGDVAKQHYFNQLSRPLLLNSEIGTIDFSETFNYLKDNREIPINTMQFEYRLENDGILITQDFLQLQQYIRDYALTNKPLSFYTSNKYQSTLPDNASLDSDITLTASDVFVSGVRKNAVKFDFAGYGGVNYIYVVRDGKVLLVTKKHTFYFNILESII